MSDILERMKKSDKFIGDVLAPFEQSLGLKFNKFDIPEDPKYVEPKKKTNLKLQLKKAERKAEKLKKMDPEEAKKIKWKAAIDKVKGIKTKDDPKLIKKAIKKKDALKNKHRKKWAERVQPTKQDKKGKKDKRGKKDRVARKGKKDNNNKKRKTK